jgi:hypothetical protein
VPQTVNGTSVTPVIAITGFTDINLLPFRSGQIYASTNGDITLTEITGAMRVGTIVSTAGNIALTVNDVDPSGDDLLLSGASSISAASGKVTLLAGDNVIVPVGSTVTAGSTVRIQADSLESSSSDSEAGSIISIAGQIFAQHAFIAGGDDNDVISLTNVTKGTQTVVFTGGGVNTVNVGIIGPPVPNQGLLANIRGPLFIVSAATDTLNFDDSGDATAWTGSNQPTLTETNLTGLGMGTPVGISYQSTTLGFGPAALNLYLGTAPQTVNVQSTAPGTTSTISTQVGGNTWNVGSLAPTTRGGVAGIQGPLVLDGGGKPTLLADTLNVDDSGATGFESGVLTDSTVTGLGMAPGGITYQGMDVLNINLGQGPVLLAGFITNNLPATTTITGGSSIADAFVANWANDFNGTLNLNQLGDINLNVAGEFYGHLNTAAPAHIQSLTVDGSVNVGSSISAQQIDNLDIGKNLDIDLTVPGIPGAPAGTWALGTATIGGTLPAGITLQAGSIESLTVGDNPTLPTGGHDLAGHVVALGDLGTLNEVLGSITTTSTVVALGNLNTLIVGPGHLSVGQNMAGLIVVLGTLGTGRIAGGTPGLFVAGHVGSIGAYGGFGPVVMHVIEAGVDRRVEEAAPGQFYLQPNANNVAGSPYVNIQYLYESAGFSSPQLSATITNPGRAIPYQFDLSTVVLQDGGKFNVARLDAVGVSDLRNLAVEGDLVPGVSAAASSFFAGDQTPAGVYLPFDNIAGVGIRDYAPNGSILTREIQGVAFGSFTNSQGQVVPGSRSTATDAARLLAAGTFIVPAGALSSTGTQTFRVTFAALPGQDVAFYLDTSFASGGFDPNDMIFTLQSDGDGVDAPTLFPATRGAVTAMIGVSLLPTGSVVQSVDLYGDGGSILSKQFIAQSVTSTGPLGDLVVLAPQGLNNVTAPRIFGNIAAAGPLFGTIQTTGVRFDPISGAPSNVSADLGRVYANQPGGRNIQPYVTATTIQGQGQDSFRGQIISRGNLISSIRSDGNAPYGCTGLIAVEGNFGAVTTLLGTPTRLGGLSVNGGFDGQLVVLGDVYSDLTFHGGLTGGRIAVKGTGGARSGILGNVIVDRGLYPTGSISAGSAIVSGGEIGDPTFGTTLSITDKNAGIVAADGVIRGNLPLGGYVFNDVAARPGNPNAAMIDAIFTQNGQPLGLDLPGVPLGGLELILEDLAALSVKNGKLAGPTG